MSLFWTRRRGAKKKKVDYFSFLKTFYLVECVEKSFIYFSTLPGTFGIRVARVRLLLLCPELSTFPYFLFIFCFYSFFSCFYLSICQGKGRFLKWRKVLKNVNSLFGFDSTLWQRVNLLFWMELYVWKSHQLKFFWSEVSLNRAKANN